MFCSKCGKEIKAGMRFCNNCGAEIKISTPEDMQTENITQSNTASQQGVELQGAGQQGVGLQDVGQQNVGHQGVSVAPVKKPLALILASSLTGVVVLGVTITLLILQPWKGKDEVRETVNEIEEEAELSEEVEDSLDELSEESSEESDNALNAAKALTELSKGLTDETGEEASDEELKEAEADSYTNKWRDAYIAYLKDKEVMSYSFDLVFIDDDDIPELFITSGIMAGGTFVVAYHDGKAEEVYTGEYGANYIERSGLIHVPSGHGGGYHDDIIRLEKGTFSTIASGWYSEWPDGTEYNWEGEEVTEDAYHAHIAELFNDAASKSMDLTGNNYYSYPMLYELVSHWPDPTQGAQMTPDEAFVDFAKSFEYVNGLGGFFDIYLEDRDYKRDLSRVPFGNIDCLIEDFDKDGQNELLLAAIDESEHLWFLMYEYTDKVELADIFDFHWDTITNGDHSTHVFCYDHDGSVCVGIFSDIGFGVGAEYCGTLQYTCLKYEKEAFSKTNYEGFVGSDGNVDPEFLSMMHKCGINLDYEQLDTYFAINNMVAATGGKRFFSIILDVRVRYGEGYSTEWVGGSAQYEGFSSYDFTYADQAKIDEWNSMKAQKTQESNAYIFADSATRLLTEGDLLGLTKDTLRIARNEIVARHGRRFKDAGLQAYFDSKDWYHGTIEADDFDIYTELNDIERTNMEFIKKYEN